MLLTWFGGQEAGRALADVLLGISEPGGRLPTTWPVVAADCPVLNTTPEDGVLRYDEGIFIGYRAWERAAAGAAVPVRPRLGLHLVAVRADRRRRHQVSVTVRNTGARPGREVVQIYVAPAGSDDREPPARWLAGFATAEAAPGEAATVEVELPARTFQVWDDGWRTVAGEYIVEAAHSIADRRLAATITIP